MIEDFIKTNNLPSYRLKQYYQAFYQQLIHNFDELTTWPTELRKLLANQISFSSITPTKKISSADGSTTKVLSNAIQDNQTFESVLIKHKDKRNTVCVSCMIGCPVNCVFCATGKMGFKRNLSAIEIVDQVLYFARQLKAQSKTVSNIVFMGMGEPLLNFENVMKAISDLTGPSKFKMSPKRITISTCGITSRIKELRDMQYKGELAISLHAPNQELRKKLIPLAKTYKLNELLEELNTYAKDANKRISYEYILIDKLNNSQDNAKELAKILNKRNSHVNLISYNNIVGLNYKRPSPKSVVMFSKELTKLGIHNTIRVTMGSEISAACGQLSNTYITI